MIFGKNNDKGISLDGSKASIVDITKEGLDAVSIHDENRENPDHAFVLSRMMQPHYPVPMGVFRDVERPTYETQLHAQVNQVEREKGEGDLKKLLFSDETWEVK